MKKFLIKLGAFGILSTILISTILISNIAYAATTEELMGALKDVSPCIDDNSNDYKNKIITFIEEPLNSGDQTIGDTRFKPCYRNTFQFTSGEGDSKKTHTLSLLGNECSANGKSLAADEANNAKFSCKEIQAVISEGGTSLIYGYIGIIYRWGASMVGIVAVLIIVISGIQISAAGGDQEAVTKAKTRILQSIAGIVVLFLSGLILYTVNPTFFTSAGSSPSTETNGNP